MKKTSYQILCLAFALLFSMQIFAQCPTLTNTANGNNSAIVICNGSSIQLQSVGNLPAGSSINWYQSNTSAFIPPVQGAFIGNTNSTTGANCPAICPSMVAVFINSCNGTGGEPDNEYIVLSSGSGFAVNDLKVDLPNSSPTGTEADINYGAGTCGYQTPSAAFITSLRTTAGCTSIFAAGPGTTVPSGAVVVLFTSNNVTATYNFAALCGSTQAIYVMQSSCARTGGAFTNSASCSANALTRLKTTYISLSNCTTCDRHLTYSRCGLTNTDGEYAIPVAGSDTSTVANGGVLTNSVNPCNGPNFATIPQPPDTLRLTYAPPTSLCNQTIYLRGVLTPTPAGCPTTVITQALPVQIVCPTPVLTPTQPTCGLNNGSILVTQANAIGYAWTGGLSGSNPTNIAPGTYTVTVTTTGNCTATTSVTLNPGIPFTASLTATQPSCGLNNGSILLNPNNAANYTWTSGLSGANPTNLGAGTYTVTVSNIAGCSTILSTTLVANGGLTVTATVTQPTCGLTNGSILINPNNATSYAWTGGLSGANPTSVPAGTYTVTVTAAAGCTATTSVTINANAVFTPTATVTAATCGLSNGSVLINPNNAINYAWTGGLSGANPTNIAAGTYTVTVTAAGGCTEIVTTTVTNNGASPILTLTSVNNLDCRNTTSLLTANSPNNVTYNFGSGAGANNTISINSPNTYTVTALDANGCTNIASVTVTQDITIPNTSLTVSNILTCNTPSATVSLVVIGPAPPGLACDFGSGFSPNPNLNVINPGVYTVTVTSANGCTVTNTVTVTEDKQAPNLSLSPSPTSCGLSNGSVLLTTNTTTYTWTGGLSGTNPINVPGGTYTVVATATNGCTTEVSTTVNVSAGLTITAIPTQPSCGLNNGTIDIVPNNAATYVWTGGLLGANPTNIAAGTYTVTVTGANNCSSTASVTLNTSMPIMATATATPTTCGISNGTIAVTPNNGTNYSWTNGLSGANPTNIPAGTYTVTVTVAGGCTASVSATVVAGSAGLVVGLNQNNNLNCTNSTIVLTAIPAINATYAWSSSAIPVPGTNTATVSTGGVYSVTVTSNGCTGATSILVTQNTVQPNISIITPSQLTCATACVPLTATVNPNTASLIWSNGSTASSIQACNAQIYTVTATEPNSGCTQMAQVAVTSDGSTPTVSIVTSPLNKTVLTCANPSISLGVVTLNNNTVAWGAPFLNGNLAQTVTVAGTYVVTVTHPVTGCTASASIVITENKTLPIISIASAPQLTCAVNCVPLTATAIPTNCNLQWSTGSANTTLSVCAAGTYTVTATNTMNGCSANIQATVLADSNIPTINFTTNPANTTELNCTITSIAITANFAAGANSIQWSAPFSNSSLATQTAISAGSFTVTVSNAVTGCTASANIVITRNMDLPLANLTSSNPLTCTQTTTTLTANGGVLYDFGTGFSPQNTFTVSTAGVYTVTVQGVNTCTNTAITRVLPPPNLVVPTQQIANLCEETQGTRVIKLSNNYHSYLWQSGETSQSITVSNHGTYSLTVTNTDGCSAVGNIVVENHCSPEIYVPTAFTPNNDGLNDVLQVFGVNIKTLEMTIYNRWGQVVFFTDDKTHLWDGNFNGSPAQAGPYTWTITYGSEGINGDIIKQSLQGAVILIRKDK